MKEKLIIIGTNTTARHVYEFIKGYELYDILGFAVDKKYLDKDEFCGNPVYAIEDLSRIFNKNDVKLFVAILWNALNSDRRKLYERLKKEEYQFANIISPTAIVRGSISEGSNCWIHDYVVVQPGAKIEENCMLMAFTLIGANSQIGAHCFTGTKSTVAGNCIVGEQSFVGINCTVFDDTKIGKKCILGACSVVKRNVEDFSVVKTDVKSMQVINVGEEKIESKLLFKENVR